jgi:hypothetical protein
LVISIISSNQTFCWKKDIMPAFASLVLMLIWSVYSKSFDLLFTSFSNFFAPDKVLDTSYITALQVIPAGIVIALLGSIVSIGILKLFKIDLDSHIGHDKISRKSHWSIGFFLLVFEEGIFRIIPMYLSNLMGWNTPVVLILTSVLFALFHIMNFQNKNQNPLSTLPQLFTGVLIASIAMSYGWWTGFLFHYVYDLVLFSTEKQRKYTSNEVAIFLYMAVVAVLGYFISGGVGFLGNTNLNTFETVNLSNQQIVGSVFVVYGTVIGLINLLGFDTPQIENDDDNPNNKYIVMLTGVLSTIVAIWVYRFGGNLFSTCLEALTVYFAIISIALFGSFKGSKLTANMIINFSIFTIILWNWTNSSQVTEIASFIKEALYFEYNPLMMFWIVLFTINTLKLGYLKSDAKAKNEEYEPNFSASEMSGRAFSLIATSYFFLIVQHCTIAQSVILCASLAPVLAFYLLIKTAKAPSKTLA